MENTNLSEALFRFRNGSNCAQAVLSTYFKALDLDEALAHRMGAGLGGGVGRKQYVCGAVNAGAIVLSAVHGNADRSDVAQKEATTLRVRKYVDEFEEEFGTSQCRGLLGMDTSTPEGRKTASEAGLFDTVCVDCIKKVCLLLEEEIGSNKKA